MDQNNPIIVIGGANVDIQGTPTASFQMGDSNPGEIKLSLGGVGRNIAENCALLGIKTKLIAAVGDDSNGDYIKENLNDRGIDGAHIIWSTDHRTSTYLYILDDQGELCVAINDMAIVDLLDEAYFEPLLPLLDQAPVVLLDANLSQAVIEYLLKHLKKTKVFFDAVSSLKALRVANVLSGIYAIKMNQNEAEALSGMTITDDESIGLIGQWFIDQGVDKVIITMGARGAYSASAKRSLFKEPLPLDIVNATGAGDAFSAGLVYGYLHGYDLEALMDFAMGAAEHTLMSEKTVEESLCLQTIEKHIEENKNVK